MTKTKTCNLLQYLTGMVIGLLMTCASTLAQERKISGVVTDPIGQPLSGVNILVQGTSIGTATNEAGKFSLTAKPGDVLQISSIGFQTQNIKLGEELTLIIKLAESNSNLNEVIVIGYGTQKKKLVTGANIQVKGEDIQKQSTTNALQALQGQAPGVQITSYSGQPGSSMNVVIRGKGTVGNFGFLYVVDGIQTSDISYLNPADIESIDVLKDAASAAIYGSQAA